MRQSGVAVLNGVTEVLVSRIHIDSVLNDALRIVTGCLRPTPTDHLPVLSGIQPAKLHRLGATLSLVYCGCLDPDHILYGLLSRSSDTCQVRLRSRCPFVPAARNLLDNLARLGICASEWTNHKWKRSIVKMLPGSVLLCPRPMQACWDELTPRSLAACFRNNNSTAYGISCWAIPFVHAQVRSRSFTELRVWRLWANRRLCSNSVPYTPGTT